MDVYLVFLGFLVSETFDYFLFEFFLDSMNYIESFFF